MEVHGAVGTATDEAETVIAVAVEDKPFPRIRTVLVGFLPSITVAATGC